MHGGVIITPHSFEDDFQIMQTNENGRFEMVKTEDLDEDRLDGLMANHRSFVGIMRRAVEQFHAGDTNYTILKH